MMSFFRPLNLKRSAPSLIFATIALLFFAFQVHQLRSFNQYWGYDGGAHLHIFETLSHQHRFPTIAENYLAWHEPLYYLLVVGLSFLHIPFWCTHLLIVLGIDVLVFALFRRLEISRNLSLAGSLAILSLPAFLEVGLFYTNEALNYVFVLGIIHAALTLWREPTWSCKTSFLFAACVGLGTVTKITTLVAFGVCVILFLMKISRTKTWKYLLTLLLAMAFSVACYAPWYLVRNDELSRVSINNYDMLPAKPFALDQRMRFMTRFDADIFRFPFWYSGGRGFWSMIYADTVSDYSGLFENQDLKNARPASGRIATTHNDTSVSAYRKPLAQAAIFLGVIPVGVMLWAIGGCLLRVRDEWKRRRTDPTFTNTLPTLGFFFAFLLALLYYSYRYPYYDQGVVKSIFIAPAFVLPVALGIKRLAASHLWVRLLVGLGWTAYTTVVLALFFIRT